MTEPPKPAGSAPVSRGTLYIVSTPIGNLGDISKRAVDVLSSVDLIAAEDTRKTGILLKHFRITTPTLSYYSYNEQKRIPGLVARLRGGDAVAVVSDAGTPAISDPAARLISAAVEENIPVVAVPGPTAFLPALIASGFPIGSFVFEGFLPVKKGRNTRLGELRAEQRTIVLYESPHRLLRTLEDLRRTVGFRRICVARELTKKFEEIVRGTAQEMIDHFAARKVRGEFVIVIEGTGGERRRK